MPPDEKDGYDSATTLYLKARGHSAGSTVITVNSVFFDHTRWEAATRRLERDNRVISYDLRGQGRSSGTNEIGSGFSFDQHCNDLLSIVEAETGEDTILLGSSAGGLICCEVARRSSSSVGGLVLSGPAFSPLGVRQRKHLAKSWLESLERGGLAMLGGHLFPQLLSDRTIEDRGKEAGSRLTRHLEETTDVDALRAQLEALHDAPGGPDILSKMECPVLLLVGEDDFRWDPVSIGRAVDSHPNLSSRRLSRAGFVPHVERPADFDRIVSRFVRDLRR